MENAGEGEIDLSHYQAVGGIANALGEHGNAILAALRPADARFAEGVFRALTTFERGRAVRRPKELGALCAVIQAESEEDRHHVYSVVHAFARRESSLLLLSTPELQPGTVIDITHESLIRKRPTLKGWAQEENRSADWYGDLVRDVVRARTGDAGTWRDPELSNVLARRDRERWNEAWANQYRRPEDPPFAEVASFLAASSADQARERRREARARRRTNLILLLLLTTIVTAVAVVYAIRRSKERELAALTSHYLEIQDKYSKKQEEADSLKARSEEARGAYLTASDAKKDQLQQQYQALELKYNQSQEIATRLQALTDDLRKNEDLVTSLQDQLLKRIQDLQTQLNGVTAERDKLRFAQAANAKGLDPNQLLKRIEDLDNQSKALTAERDRLQLRVTALERDLQRRPVLVVLPEYSALRVAPEPFGGGLALAVGEIHKRPTSYVRVFLWSEDGTTAPLPEPFTVDKKRSNRLIGKMDRPETPCDEDRPGVPVCYRLLRSRTLQGTQASARFTFGGANYELQATGWSTDFSGHPNAISLVLYRVAPGSAAR